GQTVGEAIRRAKASDPVSIYGGIVGVNRRLDIDVVKELSGILLEILFAPGFDPDALEQLRLTKKKCRVFQLPCTPAEVPARIEVMRAREVRLETRGTVCASDAFFPFRDGLDVVAEAGITAVIHPGGSLRDEEVVAAADEHGLAMVVSGIRHFKH